MIDAAAIGVEGSRVFQRKFFDMLAELCRRTLIQPATPALAIPESPEMKRVVERLFADLAEQTIPALALASAMSERTLRRRFQSELHTSPEAYLRQARLIKAMQVLRAHPAKPISEIALEVGYANQSAFSAAFRRFTQQTPAEFRHAD
jgi:AraC family transcriptional regulator